MDPIPPALFSDTMPPVTRKGPHQLFVLRIESTPLDDNPEAAEVAGGFVVCWVDEDDFRSAEIRALKEIAREGWRPRRHDESHLIELSDCVSDEDARAFAEAQACGCSIAIYAWAIGGEEEE